MFKRPPERPEKGEQLSLTAHDLTLESMSDESREVFTAMDPGDGSMDPDTTQKLLERGFGRHQWDEWIDLLFSHRFVPVKLFDTKTVEKGDHEFHVAQKETYGHTERPVLSRSTRMERHVIRAGKAICLQYALTSDRTPYEVCQDVPYDFFPSEIMRVREFLEDNGLVWIMHDDSNWWNRTPIGAEFPMEGVVYMMYTFDEEGSIVPRYIGISRKHNGDGDGLGWNFANVTSDSVFLRWGYGKSQHLGELSCAFWPEQYSWEPEPKYKQWKDELFHDGTRLLEQPVYFEMLPWFSDDVMIAEDNLIKIGSHLFGDKLLNTQQRWDGQTKLV